MEQKKRFKMYKSGKNWVIAPIVFLGLTVLSMQAVSADDVQSSAASSQTAQVSSVSESSSSQVSSSTSSQSSEVTPASDRSSDSDRFVSGNAPVQSSATQATTESSLSSVVSSSASSQTKQTREITTDQSSTSTSQSSTSSAEQSSSSSQVAISSSKADASSETSSQSSSVSSVAESSNSSSTEESSSVSSEQTNSSQETTPNLTKDQVEATNENANQQNQTNTDEVNNTSKVSLLDARDSSTPYIDISKNQGYVTADTIDISSYQPNMSVSDFQTLKKYGIKNVIVKTSQYSNYVNPYAAQQIANAKAAGLNVAVYHYAGFANPAQATEEADYWVGVLNNLGISKDTAVICDLEDDYTKNSQVGDSLNAFWKELANKGYTNQVLYVYEGYANQYPAVLSTVSKNKIWLAQYPYNPTSYKHTEYGAWQFSDNGHCPGISYTLDLSHCYNSSIFSSGELSGQQYVNGHWQYYENGQAVKSQYVWIADQKKEVYYDGNGNMVYGQQKINGKWQYFDTVTGAQAKNQYVWIADQKKEVYYDGLGNMVYGQQKINGKWQYFDTVTGAQAKNKYVWIADQKKEVYYDGLGNMVYGQQKINGKWQYFDKVTGAQAKNQYVWIADQKKEVYYDENGNMVYGWQIVDGHKQYFDPTTGAQVKDATVIIDGKKYCFNKLGNLVE